MLAYLFENIFFIFSLWTVWSFLFVSGWLHIWWCTSIFNLCSPKQTLYLWLFSSQLCFSHLCTVIAMLNTHIHWSILDVIVWFVCNQCLLTEWYWLSAMELNQFNWSKLRCSNVSMTISNLLVHSHFHSLNLFVHLDWNHAKTWQCCGIFRIWAFCICLFTGGRPMGAPP